MLDRQLIFFPSKDMAATPADVGLPYEDIFFTSSDGVELHGWFVPGSSNLTLLWFHGNAGNISSRIENLLLFNRSLEANIFIFDYRGYGRSQGRPTEQGIYLDAEAALEYLRSEKRVSVKDDLALFGRSLGSSVAVELAVRHKPKAVILESPITSIRSMARRSHPLLSAIVPVGLVVQSKFDTLSKVRDVQSPVMVMHGDKDDLVPIEMGREIFDAANEPKRFYTIEDAGHNDTFYVGGEAYFEAFKQFLED